MRIFRKIILIFSKIVLIILMIIILFFVYFNIPVKDKNKKKQLGITFSGRYASDIGMDPQKTFLAILDELKVKKIRLPIYWDLVEKEEGRYDFSEVDWQLREAEKRQAEIILVVGQKVPRWPECAIPDWANKTDQKRKNSLLRFLNVAINRYKNNSTVKYWQVENEPFLRFGICPVPDADLLDQEIALVRKIDRSREIIVTDSGELSFWLSATKRADIFGTTLYRTIYKEPFGYITYPVGPRFFHFKYWIIKIFAHQKKAIIAELQAEPWISGWTVNAPLEEQFRSMNVSQLNENVSYAQKTGFEEIYLWGAEWWYWLKMEKNHPELWQEGKELFSQS